jgi:hypothetical protein
MPRCHRDGRCELSRHRAAEETARQRHHRIEPIFSVWHVLSPSSVLAKLQSFGSRVQQGTCCECVSLRLEAWFTTLTGSPSRLPETTFFDCAFVHLLSTATLDRLRALYPQGRFEVRRFRPNIAVETANDEKDFVENVGSGKRSRSGMPFA